MEEIEIKLEIFKAINSQNLCDTTHYMSPLKVASWTNEVYEILAKKNNYNI